MKPAAEWLNEVGETVMFSAFAGGKPPGIEVEKLIKRIQIDALEHATGLGGINIGGQDCVFKVNIHRAIEELKKDL